MRGKTAKRIRRVGRQQLFAGHLSKQIPLPQSGAEADYQMKRMSKTLKRLWRQLSKPKSLSWVDEKKQLPRDFMNLKPSLNSTPSTGAV